MSSFSCRKILCGYVPRIVSCRDIDSEPCRMLPYRDTVRTVGKDTMADAIRQSLAHSRLLWGLNTNKLGRLAVAGHGALVRSTR